MEKRDIDNPWGVAPEKISEIHYGPGMDLLKTRAAKWWPGCTVDFKFIDSFAGDNIMKYRAHDGHRYYEHGQGEIIMDGKVVARIKTFLSTD